VAGNTPLLLDDPETLWLVVAGWVDVFAIHFRPGQSMATRVFLFRAEAGQILFGVKGGGRQRTGLLAMGTTGSQVVALPRTEFAERAAGAAQIGQLVALVDGWVQGLTAGVARGRLLPRNVTTLDSGQKVLCQEGMVSPVRGTLWIAGPGEHHFLGETSLAVEASGSPFPLAVPGWLAVQQSDLATLSTEAVLSEAGWWSGLQRFHEVIAACVALNVAKAENAERARFDRRARRDRQLRHVTLAALAAVSEPVEDEALPVGPEEGMLVGACRLVGAVQGIAIRPAPRSVDADRRSDPVQAVAQASRVRVRRVLLTGTWWHEDNGPLLAFRAIDNHPLALLPASPSRYDLADPATGKRGRLTPRDAANLAPFAYQFYRPFPAGRLTPLTLFKFGLVGSKRDWWMVGLLGLAGGILALFPPLATGWLFDSIIPAQEQSQLLILMLALLVTGLVGVMFRVARGVATMRVETVMDSEVQAALWDRLLNLPVPFFRQFTAGDLASRASGISTIRWLLTDVALATILNLVFSSVYMVALFFYHVQLALVACLLFLVVGAVTCLAGFRELPFQRRIYQLRGKISGLVLQLITGLTRIHAAGAEDRALAVWAREFGKQRRLQFQARLLTNGLATFDAVAPLATTMVLFALVAWMPREELSLGAFLAFNVAFVRLLGSALSMSDTVSSIIQVVPLYERARPILDATPEAEWARQPPGDLRGDIEISHVSFRYGPESPLILNDVSIRIRPGEFVAFVGPSGAGKSTILRLLLGFETPTLGSVFFDRVDLSRLDRQALRRQIGVVLQNSRILPGTLFANIVGSAPLTLEDAWEAARLAGLDEEIQRLPLGMDTVLPEGGGTLSGGQRQRLLIARAVVTRPRILFFDEATSALDNATQAKVSRSLESLKATRVVVAHRLSTIVNADRIFVLDRGRVIQRGTYDKLLRQGGVFAELVKRQLT
jgi:NHLM bacteriocin system ABC transporter ATP-binding protein